MSEYIVTLSTNKTVSLSSEELDKLSDLLIEPICTLELKTGKVISLTKKERKEVEDKIGSADFSIDTLSKSILLTAKEVNELSNLIGMQKDTAISEIAPSIKRII